MTFEDVARIFAHWKHYPPVRDLVAAAVGFQPAEPDDQQPSQVIATAEDMRRLMQVTGGRQPGT